MSYFTSTFATSIFFSVHVLGHYGRIIFALLNKFHLNFYCKTVFSNVA